VIPEGRNMHAWIDIVIVVVLIGFGVASFFVRRRGESKRPRPGWRQTNEVFKDPSSDRTMRVWVDDAGARHYVPES
jgi:hypothetical protein